MQVFRFVVNIPILATLLLFSQLECNMCEMQEPDYGV